MDEPACMDTRARLTRSKLHDSVGQSTHGTCGKKGDATKTASAARGPDALDPEVLDLAVYLIG